MEDGHDTAVCRNRGMEALFQRLIPTTTHTTHTTAGWVRSPSPPHPPRPERAGTQMRRHRSGTCIDPLSVHIRICVGG